MAQEEKKPRAKIDWEGVERDYRIGQLTIRQIQEKYKVSNGGMMARAKKRGWTRDAKVDVYSSDFVASLRRNSKPGFVYVITFDAGDGERFYKIGMSDDPVKRLASHQCASPFDMRIVVSYFTGNMFDEERELHSMFNSARVRGEWFELGKNDLEKIAKRSVTV